ncbi:MAG: 4-hydroxy-tetrahydrodipicolinate reductase [Actinomycetota bacterium]
MRVGVLGSHGRMGQAVVESIAGAPDLTVACALDLDDPREALTESRAQVLVDFTTPQAVMGNITFGVENGIACVVGTSGFTPDRLAQVRDLVDSHAGSAVFIAPNFGIGAVLMMRFARMAAPYFGSVEIIEMHHPGKVDAPSGTALHTAHLIAQAREGRAAAPDATRMEDQDARGRSVQGVPIHSIRLQGLVAHQEVLFGSPGETLSIRHDSLDRGSFMPGVLLAIREMSTRTGLVVGVENLLEL